MNCPECAAPVVPIRGELVCQGCDLVTGPIIDSFPRINPEITGIDGYGPPAGPNTGTSLITYISDSNRDARGAALPEAVRNRFSHLSTLNVRVLGRRDRSSKRLNRAVSDLCLRLSVPSEVQRRAFYVAKTAREQGIVRGTEFSVLSAAALLLAVREARIWLDSRDVVAVAGISRSRPQKQVDRAYTRLKRALGIRIAPMTPESMLPAAATRLGLSPIEVRLVEQELRRIERHKTARVDLATALLIVARRCGWTLTMATIAGACGTSDVSVRNRIAELAPQFRFRVGR